MNRNVRKIVTMSIIAIALIAAVIIGIPYLKAPSDKQTINPLPSPTAIIQSTVTKPSPLVSASPSPVRTEAPAVQETVDIAMIGSEMEGMYLARAAADEGLKVKIIDPRDAIGGQLLQGEMLFLDETRDGAGKLLVQGRSKELFDGFRNGKIRKLSEFITYFDKLYKDIPMESGIKIEKIETAMTAESREGVRSVTYRSKDGTLKQLHASYWVENSDYAALASQLKVTRLPGLEAFYGKDTIEYMSSGMMMKFKNVDWNKFNTHFNSLTAAERNSKYGYGSVNASFAIGLSGMTSAYKPTNERVFLRGLNAVSQRDGEVIINAFLIYTVDPSDEKSVAEAIELGRKEIPLILNHFRKNIVGWENAELNGFPNYLYVREYNHYETDHVLQVSDLLGGKTFKDNVSIGGYPLDLQGISIVKWGIEMGRPDKYGMPLGSFLLKNYDNVIMAGKNVGSTAVAYGSTRIQPNTALAAESIGVILGQIQGKKKLRELKDADWPPLHAYLESKYNIKLSGVQGENKIAGWSAEEIRKLNTGEIIFPVYAAKRK